MADVDQATTIDLTYEAPLRPEDVVVEIDLTDEVAEGMDAMAPIMVPR